MIPVSSPKVVVVANATPWRQRAVRHLEKAGVAVAMFELPRDAARFIRDTPSVRVLVITDDADRDAVLAALSRVMFTRPSLHVLFLAADTSVESMVAPLQIGQTGGKPALDFLSKVYDYSSLTDLVCSHIASAEAV